MDGGVVTLTRLGPDRWRISTPDTPRDTLDDAAVLDSALCDGDPWTPATRERAASAIAHAGARRAARRLLRQRPRSQAELRERLVGRFSAEVVERVVNSLVESGAVDDRRLAHALADHMASVTPHGRNAIRRRLEGAMVNRGLVEGALASHAPASDERARANAAAESQLRRLQTLGLDQATLRRRLLAALGRRGFEADDAYDAVEALLGPADDQAEADHHADA